MNKREEAFRLLEQISWPFRPAARQVVDRFTDEQAGAVAQILVDADRAGKFLEAVGALTQYAPGRSPDFNTEAVVSIYRALGIGQHQVRAQP